MKVGSSHSFFTWLYFGSLGLPGNSGENILLELALINSDECYLTVCPLSTSTRGVELLVDRVNPQLIVSPQKFSKSRLWELKIQQVSQ